MRASCESPSHEGDRLVDRRDLLERRIEWRDLVTQARWRVQQIRRECKDCVRRETDKASHPELFEVGR